MGGNGEGRVMGGRGASGDGSPTHLEEEAKQRGGNESGIRERKERISQLYEDK